MASDRVMRIDPRGLWLFRFVLAPLFILLGGAFFFLVADGSRYHGLLAIALVACGVILLLWRSVVVIDLDQKRVWQSQGLSGILTTDNFPIDSFQEVTIAREVHQGNQGQKVVVFRVSLSGTGRELAVNGSTSFDLARSDAERIAGFMGIGLRDKTAHEAVREAGRLNESVRQRLRREGSKPSLPDHPAGTKLTIAQDPASVRIDIAPPGPARGIWENNLPLLLVWLGFGAFTFYVFEYVGGTPAGIYPTESDGMFALVTILVFVTPFAVLLLGLLRTYAKRERVTIRGGNLTAIRDGILFSRRVDLPGEHIEEVVVVDHRTAFIGIGGGAGVVVRTDTSSCEIGDGLSREDMTCLKGAVIYGLGSGNDADTRAPVSPPGTRWSVQPYRAAGLAGIIAVAAFASSQFGWHRPLLEDSQRRVPAGAIPVVAPRVIDISFDTGTFAVLHASGVRVEPHGDEVRAQIRELRVQTTKKNPEFGVKSVGFGMWTDMDGTRRVWCSQLDQAGAVLSQTRPEAVFENLVFTGPFDPDCAVGKECFVRVFVLLDGMDAFPGEVMGEWTDAAGITPLVTSNIREPSVSPGPCLPPENADP